MLQVQIVLFDGFDLLDAIAPYEVFSAAVMMTDNAISVELVTAEGPRFVTSGINGLKIEASGRLYPEVPGIILCLAHPVTSKEMDLTPSRLF